MREQVTGGRFGITASHPHPNYPPGPPHSPPNAALYSSIHNRHQRRHPATSTTVRKTKGGADPLYRVETVSAAALEGGKNNTNSKDPPSPAALLIEVVVALFLSIFYLVQRTDRSYIVQASLALLSVAPSQISFISTLEVICFRLWISIQTCGKQTATSENVKAVILS